MDRISYSSLKLLSYFENLNPQKSGIFFSIIIHLFILLFMVGLPNFFSPKEIYVPNVIPIEILNVTNTGRVKNARILGDYGTYQITGVDIRKRMNLKSTLVRFKFIEENENKSSDETPKLFPTKSSENKPLTHIVRVGDSLILIADQYDVSVESLVALNLSLIHI